MALSVLLMWELSHPDGRFNSFKNGNTQDFSAGNVTRHSFNDLFTSSKRLGGGVATDWQKGLIQVQIEWVQKNLHVFKVRREDDFPPKRTNKDKGDDDDCGSSPSAPLGKAM
jgi:hypothetical protein